MLVQDVMSTGVVTAKRNDSVRAVVTKMLSRHCGAIPVVEDGEVLIGMVTLRDVLIPSTPTTANIFTTTCTVETLSRWRRVCGCALSAC